MIELVERGGHLQSATQSQVSVDAISHSPY